MTAADLIYDNATHTTKTADGRDVPHVTRILAETGISTDFEGLASLSPHLAEKIAYRRELGRVVHLDAWAFDDGDLVWATVDPASRPFVDAWETCRINLGLIPLVRERRIYHPIDDFTGFLDGIFARPSTGQRILGDLKIGDPEDAGCVYQTAAYEAAYLAEHPGFRIDERWAIQLCPGLSVPYRITNYSARPDAWRDYHAFRAFRVTYASQAARRRAA